MNVHTDTEILYQLLISFGIGCAIGVEREYRSKAAGLRTMIMICLGSTIFTQISIGLGGAANPDRIAAAIVSGIGFLGAGVIFKDDITVTGITTATTIWIAAALGMAVGAGQYFTALVSGSVVLFVLIVFENVKTIIERMRQTRAYRITFSFDSNLETSIESKLNALKIEFHRKKDYKTEKSYVAIYETFGSEIKLNEFSNYLRAERSVHTFEY